MLKKAATALRAAIDTVLRPLELTVPQYSCLEVLDQRPGLSSSELARATFVTRQSMNLVLQGLQQRGLLTRAAVADHGKALPTGLTDAGRVQLRAASVAVRTIGHVTALDHVFLPALFVGALGGAAFGQLIGPRSGLRNVRGENGGPGGRIRCIDVDWPVQDDACTSRYNEGVGPTHDDAGVSAGGSRPATAPTRSSAPASSPPA